MDAAGALCAGRLRWRRSGRASGWFPTWCSGTASERSRRPRLRARSGWRRGCGSASRRGMLMGSLPRAEELAVLDGVEEAAALFGGELSVPLVSGVTGGVVDGPAIQEGGYWRRQARSPVAFGAGVRTLAELGVGVVVEIGPRAALGPMASSHWPASGGSGSGPTVLTSQRGPGCGGEAGICRRRLGGVQGGARGEVRGPVRRRAPPAGWRCRPTRSSSGVTGSLLPDTGARGRATRFLESGIVRHGEKRPSRPSCTHRIRPG